MNLRKYESELKKYAKNVVKGKDDYISFVLDANFGREKHIMQVGEENFKFYKDLEREIALFEKAELEDLQNLGEYGRGKKR